MNSDDFYADPKNQEPQGPPVRRRKRRSEGGAGVNENEEKELVKAIKRDAADPEAWVDDPAPDGMTLSFKDVLQEVKELKDIHYEVQTTRRAVNGVLAKLVALEERIEKKISDVVFEHRRQAS